MLFTDPYRIVKQVEQRYNHYLREFGITDPVVIVNNSGGKDSGVVDLLASKVLGGNFRSVAADTGNEHPWTINHLKTLHTKRGGNPVEIVQMEYTQEQFDKRAEKVRKQWAQKQRILSGSYRGVIMPSLARKDTKFAEQWRHAAKRVGWGEFDAPLDAFDDAFKRSGNPFLDMCLLHGGFPLGRQRFCTEELKMQVVLDKVLTPLLDEGHDVIQWSGVRADESEKRSTYPMFEVDKRDPSGQLFNFLPIHDLNINDIWAVYHYFGIKPNPLYSHGMTRVGCMPCILVKKPELAEIAKRFPEEIERVAKWELQVSKVSRWMHWMIVGHTNRRSVKMPTVERVGKLLKVIPGHILRQLSPTLEAYSCAPFVGPRGDSIGGNIYEAVDWANGDAFGTYDLLINGDNAQCNTKYGFCG